MTKVPPFLQALFAGGLAAVVTSVLIWLFTVTGLFTVLDVPVAAPATASWFTWRIAWGCIFGLFFFVPILTGLREAARGLVVSVLPILKLFLWNYPREGLGWFGLGLGVLLPITVVVAWLLWGLLAGLLLDWWGFATYEPEEEEIPPR